MRNLKCCFWLTFTSDYDPPRYIYLSLVSTLYCVIIDNIINVLQRAEKLSGSSLEIDHEELITFMYLLQSNFLSSTEREYSISYLVFDQKLRWSAIINSIILSDFVIPIVDRYFTNFLFISGIWFLVKG